MRSGVVRLFVAAALAALFALAAGCSAAPGSGGDVSGSGVPASKQYDYDGFSSLRVDNAFSATVTRGDAFGVRVTVDDNLVKYLRAELDGGTLRIGLDPLMSYHDATLKAEVTMPGPEGLEVTGGSTAAVAGFASDKGLELQLSGAGKVSLSGVRAGDVAVNVSGGAGLTGELEAQALTGEVSGAGKVGLEGSASRAQLEASGAGELDLRTFTVQDAELQLSGGARGAVRVTGTLNVEASGGAQLDYFGSPTIGRMEVSGGAQVRKAGD